MTSAIDPSKPEDGMPEAKGDMRPNWGAAKTEIEAPQAGLPVVLLSGMEHGVWIDLDGTVEQILIVPHGLSARPAAPTVFAEPVAPVRSEHRLPRIHQVFRAELTFAVKLQTGSGTPVSRASSGSSRCWRPETEDVRIKVR